MNSVEKKINLEEIINKMQQKYGKDGLSAIEKARYLYIELGKLFRYELNYVTMFERKQEDIYFRPVDFDNITSNSWICIQMSNIYVEALKRVGVEASTQRSVNAKDDDYEMPHKYTVINLPDGREIIADLVYDLAFIQLGMKTLNFGSNSEEGQKDVLSQDEIKEIDDKISYTFKVSANERAYTEYFLELIKQELNDPEKMRDYIRSVYNGEEYKHENLISYKFDLIRRFFPLDSMGFREGSKCLGILYRDFFSEEDKKKVSYFLLDYEPHENHVIGNVEQVACYCYKKDKDRCEYYIYEEGKSIEPISRESLREKLEKKKYIVFTRKNANKEEYGDDIFFE